MNDAKRMYTIAMRLSESIRALSQDCWIQNDEQIGQTCRRITSLVSDSRLYRLAIQRRWLLAAEKLQARIRRTVLDLGHEAQSLKGLLDQPAPKPPALSELVAELMQMEDEFGPLKCDLKEGTLSVCTEPITLEDVSLGSFQIKLFLERIGRMHREIPYRIIALDPNPAGSDSSVTHPHVSGEYLCEGDGHILIRKALEQGRLCDFFNLVIGILNTYNPDSPYIRLDDWDGFSCYDCGRTISREDSYTCEYCENDFCDYCSSYCQICEATLCLNCTTACPQCQKPVCPRCTAVCADCGQTFCKDCIDENGLCPSCQDQRKDECDEDEQANTTAA